jgi:hypothetical protein
MIRGETQKNSSRLRPLNFYFRGLLEGRAGGMELTQFKLSDEVLGVNIATL